MTEYIYIAANAPLRSGLVNGKKVNGQLDEYPVAITDYFYFEENRDVEKGERFNFSTHFPFKLTKYQVTSLPSDLPEFKNRDNQAAKVKHILRALNNYIHEQFENGCQHLLILYSLNSYENEPLKAKEEIRLDELKEQDLYYAEGRLLTIRK